MIQPASAENQVENGDSRASAAQGAARNVENNSFDADLSRLIELWPTLSEPLRAAILAVVRAAED